MASKLRFAARTHLIFVYQTFEMFVPTSSDKTHSRHLVKKEPATQTFSETLPDQVCGALHTPEQYRTGAQYHSIAPNFDQTFLIEADPVGK